MAGVRPRFPRHADEQSDESLGHRTTDCCGGPDVCSGRGSSYSPLARHLPHAHSAIYHSRARGRDSHPRGSPHVGCCGQNGDDGLQQRPTRHLWYICPRPSSDLLGVDRIHSPGLVLLTHSWPLLLTQLGVYAVFKLRIHYEDECLERRFGEAYLTYRRQVNELIPIPDVSETMSHSIEGIMFCNACGTVLQPRQAFCSKCGKQIVGRVSVGQSLPGRVEKHLPSSAKIARRSLSSGGKESWILATRSTRSGQPTSMSKLPHSRSQFLIEIMPTRTSAS